MQTKKPEKEKSKMGRPVKKIDKEQFETMCQVQCTLEEICLILGLTDKTLNKWCKETYGMTFSEVFRQKRELGKASLRRRQFALAKTNATMAIFLGKNWLGQKDTAEVAVNPEILRRAEELLGGIPSVID
ncbi:MAG: hypothetical protein K6F28_09910 [Lachnospiraceae bacterium]|nr:hypothetical protein [Lachnospiraceae bacterium]